MDDLVYIFDGSFTGLLCCVFEAYDKKENPMTIAEEEGLQLGFGQSTKVIHSSLEKAARVETGFIKTAGAMAMKNAGMVFFSKEPDRATVAFRYFLAGFTYGYKVQNMLTHRDVHPVFEICFNITREADHFRGFVRFSLLENGVYFAKINPKNRVLPFIMPHFVDRFSVQPFIIYDETNAMAGVHTLDRWEIIEAQELNLPPTAEGEELWVELWRHFCDRLVIDQRINLKGQMNFCPKRFWQNMPEMQPDLTTANKENPQLPKGSRAIKG